MAISPIPPTGPFTDPVIKAARRVLGACSTCSEKIAAFKAAGFEWPDEEAVNEKNRQVAESLIAASEVWANNAMNQV